MFTIDQINELTKCKNSLLYFIYKYVRVVGKNGKLISPVPYKHFERLLSEIENRNEKIIVRTSRVCGISILIDIINLRRAMFFSGEHIAHISPNRHMSRIAIKRTRDIISGLPTWMNDSIEIFDNTIIFDSGSIISYKVDPESIEYPPTSVTVDNAAMNNSNLDKLENFNCDVLITSQSVNTDRKSFFNSLFGAAILGLSKFTPINIGYKDTDNKNDEIQEMRIKTLGALEYALQFSCELVNSSPFNTKAK